MFGTNAEMETSKMAPFKKKPRALCYVCSEVLLTEMAQAVGATPDPLFASIRPVRFVNGNEEPYRRRRATSITDMSAEVSCSSPLPETEAEKSSGKIREKEEWKGSSGEP